MKRRCKEPKAGRRTEMPGLLQRRCSQGGDNGGIMTGTEYPKKLVKEHFLVRHLGLIRNYRGENVLSRLQYYTT
jgi:hypothetical protein